MKLGGEGDVGRRVVCGSVGKYGWSGWCLFGVCTVELRKVIRCVFVFRGPYLVSVVYIPIAFLAV